MYFFFFLDSADSNCQSSLDDPLHLLPLAPFLYPSSSSTPTPPSCSLLQPNRPSGSSPYKPHLLIQQPRQEPGRRRGADRESLVRSGLECGDEAGRVRGHQEALPGGGQIDG